MILKRPFATQRCSNKQYMYNKTAFCRQKSCAAAASFLFYWSPELYGLQYVGGSVLTLWALFAGTVERLEVGPLAVFAPGAR